MTTTKIVSTQDSTQCEHGVALVDKCAQCAADAAPEHVPLYDAIVPAGAPITQNTFVLFAGVAPSALHDGTVLGLERALAAATARADKAEAKIAELEALHAGPRNTWVQSFEGRATVGHDCSCEVCGATFEAIGSKKVLLRGVDFDCENCGKREGSFRERGFHRCNACGYPSQ